MFIRLYCFSYVHHPFMELSAGFTPLLRYRYRRERVDVGDDVDDDGPVGLQRLLERGAHVGGLLDADAERADVLGDLGEVLPGVGPEFLAALGLLAAVDAVEAAL